MTVTTRQTLRRSETLRDRLKESDTETQTQRCTDEIDTKRHRVTNKHRETHGDTET